MKSFKITTLLAGATFVGMMGCSNFLGGGEMGTDPNRPRVANPRQLYVGIQSNTWALYGGDLSRLASLFTQQAVGLSAQYVPTYQYSITEQTTNGQHSAFYTFGGLVDLRKAQAAVGEVGDTLFLGILQVQEAMQISLAADIFGDLVYSEALKGGNPPLDKQVDIYNALLLKLDSAITNINSTAETNAGPEDADLVYWTEDTPEGREAQKEKWVALAHSLKARIYMHLAELDPANYVLARNEAALGIKLPENDYQAVYSGVPGENNMLYQFTQEQRPGQIAPNEFIINLMRSRNDPRFSDYFSTTISTTNGVVDTSYDYSASFVSPTRPQKVVSASENLLIWAEAAFQTNQPNAGQLLRDYRVANGLPNPIPPTGDALLREILTEKYIALFHQVEPFNDYKRNCFPNLVPTVPGSKLPGRLFYDSNERNTNSSMPSTTDQPTRNQNDPANATDPFGATCLGQ